MGDIETTTKQVKLAQWSEMIRQCKNSGMTVRSWCRENDINEKVYYYRQRKVKETLLKMEGAGSLSLKIPTSFAKVPASISSMSEESPVTSIKINEIKVDVYESTSEESIKRSLRAVLSLC